MDIQPILNSIWLWILGFLQQIPEYLVSNVQLIIQVIVLLFCAWIVGRLVKFAAIKILDIIGLKRITSRTWAESLLKATGYRGNIMELIGDLVKWLVYILFLALIIQTAGFPGLADMFTQVAIFMPRFIGAILLIVIGFIIADFFGKVFEEAGRRFFGEETLAKVLSGFIKYSIALITLIMALSLIGLDTASLTIMFAGIVVTMIAVLLIGIKDIFPNFSAGLQLQKTLKPGERIKIGDHSGTLEKINSFSITLKTKSGHVTIPNSMLVNNPIEKLGK